MIVPRLGQQSYKPSCCTAWHSLRHLRIAIMICKIYTIRTVRILHCVPCYTIVTHSNFKCCYPLMAPFVVISALCNDTENVLSFAKISLYPLMLIVGFRRSCTYSESCYLVWDGTEKTWPTWHSSLRIIKWLCQLL